jgi:pyoverdine/dityrosine biosynthesis protein Dit1
MLTTLSQAKTLVQKKIEEIEPIALEDIEKDILDTLVEDLFSSKIEDLIDEQEIDNQKFQSEEALDAYLFNKIPNYTSLLEETVAEVIAEYISADDEID